MNHRLWFCVLLLWACADRSAATYFITNDTATQLFANATHTQSDGNEFIAVTCTFSEGFWCYYLPDPKDTVFVEAFDPLIQTPEHLLEQSVSKHLLSELDPKRVERAKQNTVLIKCQRSDEAIQCTINGGTQEEPLGIR